ncbi:MAG: DUF3990 domain-containing protein [Oligosphaeraceae bacterium]
MTARVLYHVSRQPVRQPAIRPGLVARDFGPGFVCTEIKAQAQRWAARFTPRGTISVFLLEDGRTRGLRKRVFPRMTNAWLDFILACRLGIPHSYDLVEGPMADDSIFNFVQEFADGAISRQAFWALAQFRYPAHQLSFHTPAALDALTYLTHERLQP